MEKTLFSILELAYSPITSRDFTYIKKELVFQQILKSSSLYIVAKRNELYFNNVRFNNKFIFFSIKQNNNHSTLECKLPIHQENITKGKEFDKFYIVVEGLNEQQEYFEDIRTILIYREKVKEDNFLIWLTPEKILQHYWKNSIEVEIKGSINKFLDYDVLYVGKATSQDIWKRLSGHEALQDILSLESPKSWGTLTSNEVVLLFYKFNNNVHALNIGQTPTIEEMTNVFMGKVEFPQEKTIFLDAEKALIKALTPKYNKQLFKNYPQSIDGLFSYNYNGIIYLFKDPISLSYKSGKITGNMSYLESDAIVIKEGKVSLHKKSA